MGLETVENPSKDEIKAFEDKKARLKEAIPETLADCATAQWYKMKGNEIGILVDEKNRGFVELSKRSNVVKGLMACEQMRLYVPRCRKAQATHVLAECGTP